jgi:hypothetical protein
MPLNIGASGSIKPYAKYNSKADKWFARGDEGDVEIGRPTFAADFANIATGWFRFREGEAPERRIDPSLDRPAPSPGEGFKRGFVMTAYSQKFFSGAVELASASIHMGNAIRELYQAYDEQRGSHPGQLPVIACVGSEAMKDKYGTNYKPKLQIVKWVGRPSCRTKARSMPPTSGRARPRRPSGRRRHTCRRPHPNPLPTPSWKRSSDP